MPCTRPLAANMGHDGGVSFKLSESDTDRRLTLPCGKCIKCLRRRQTDWSIRVIHTMQMDPGYAGCFVTLTYSPDELPSNGLLEVEALQQFLKRLRHKTGPGLKYLAAGEFGEAHGRPHYHLCLVGYSPSGIAQNGFGLDMDPVIQDAWGLGETHVGTLNIASAKYTAKYVTKGAKAPPHPTDDPDDPVISRKAGEFLLSSKAPALGKTFVKKYWRDIYRSGFDRVVLGDRQYSPPRYYDRWLREERPEEWIKVRERRLKAAPKLKDQPGNWLREKAEETTALKNSQLFLGK